MKVAGEDLAGGRDLTKEDVLKAFSEGVDCGQLVAAEFSEELGISKTELMKMASSFGAGSFSGSICGALLGCNLVLALLYGHSGPGEGDKKGRLVAHLLNTRERFAKKMGNVECFKLLGGSMMDPKESEEIVSSGRMESVCPECVICSVAIIRDILNKEGA